MATIATSDPQVQSALRDCLRALERVAAYQLAPALEQRMQELGENKEFLDPAAHGELLALVDFAQQRTMEKLEAGLALQKLREVWPEGIAS